MFDGTEAVQTLLLMAHNGVSGPCGDSCLALVTVMEDGHLAWIREVFGGECVGKMEVLVELDSITQPAAQPQSAWLKFPDFTLPKLSVVQPKVEIEYVEIAGEGTFMDVPGDSLAACQVPGTSHIVQTQPSSKEGMKLSAAEQLVADYGHLERRALCMVFSACS